MHHGWLMVSFLSPPRTCIKGASWAPNLNKRLDVIAKYENADPAAQAKPCYYLTPPLGLGKGLVVPKEMY